MWNIFHFFLLLLCSYRIILCHSLSCTHMSVCVCACARMFIPTIDFRMSITNAFTRQSSILNSCTHTPESPPLKLSLSPFISLSWSLESQYRHHSNNSRAQTWSISKWKHILNRLIAIVKIWKHYTICTGHTLRHHLQLLRNRRDVLVEREAIFINRMIDFRIKANSSTNTCNETEKKIGFEMVNIV